MATSVPSQAEQRAVSIPKTLYERIEKRIEGTSFQSVSDYVVHVLREFDSEIDSMEEKLSRSDEEKVKRRLMALGYLE